jgi:uncharacterized protein (TIGR01777 family)
MIGRALRAQLETEGAEVRVLVRRPARAAAEYPWEGTVGTVPQAAVAWADAVASLGGAPIARLPWTKAYRREIMDSRVDSASALAQAILRADDPPKVWVSASATGFYGDAAPTRADLQPEALTESSPSGSGFLAAVVRAWEAAALPAASATRLVRARTGMVLGRGEGTLKPLAAATRLGLGARFGDGRQFWPWISLRDEVRAWAFALRDESIRGPVNLVGPTLATAGEVTGAVAHALRRPHRLAVPAGVLRAALDGAAEDLLLASQPVRPGVLEAHGFEFLDRTAPAAIRTVLAG